MPKRREKGGNTKSSIATRTKTREINVESRRRKSSSIDIVDKSTNKRKEEHKHGRNKQASGEKNVCTKTSEMLRHDKNITIISHSKTTNEENEISDNEGNISDNKINNGSKHDNIVEGTIQVDNLEENWKRRKDALFISETKNINEDKKCSLYDQKNIVRCSDEEFSPDNSDSSHTESFSLKNSNISY